MPAGEVVLLLAMVLAGIAGAGGMAVRYERRRRAEMRRSWGEENAQRAIEDSELVCRVCGQAVNPVADVFQDGAWVHTVCFEKELKENRNGQSQES